MRFCSGANQRILLLELIIRINLSFNIQDVKRWLWSCKSIFYTEVYNNTVTTGGWLSCMIVISSMYSTLFLVVKLTMMQLTLFENLLLDLYYICLSVYLFGIKKSTRKWSSIMMLVQPWIKILPSLMSVWLSIFRGRW